LECGGVGGGELSNEPVRPDPFYVDQAASTLEHLSEMGIPLVCERWMTLPPNPDLVDIDRLYQNISKQGKRLDSSSLRLASLSGTGGVVLRRTKSVERLTTFDQKSLTSSETSSDIHTTNDRTAKGRRRSSSFSENSEEMQTAFRGDDEKPKDTPADLDQLPRSGQRSRHNFTNLSNKSGSSVTTSSLASSSAAPHLHRSSGGSFKNVHQGAVTENDEEEELVTYRISQLTTGTENVLLHHVHLDIGDGVFLSPIQSQTDKPLHQEFVENFRASAQIIHSTFQMSIRHRDNFRASFNSANHSQPMPWTNKTLVAIKEQAMLFHWTPNVKKKTSSTGGTLSKTTTLSYWVCGRVVQSPSDVREFYVAYHESASQNMVELAFRLAFGIHL